MTRFFNHPSDSLLARSADARNGAVMPARVRRHLADCQRCRDRLGFARELATRVEALGGPLADASLLARIHARVEAGEQVLLPAAAAEHRGSLRPWLAAAGIVVAAVAGMMAWSAPMLRAGARTGELRFSSDRIVHRPMRVEYTDEGLFSGARELVLRARYRTPDDLEYNDGSRQRVVAHLAADGHGHFTGSLLVPASVVYAAFAVEAADGSRVDDNAHRLWYLLAYDGHEPSLAALEQRSNDLMGNNAELALRVIQERARLYEDSPKPWANVVAFERFALGQAHDDSMLPVHCARLQRLDSEYRAVADVATSDVAALRDYAVQLDATRCPAARLVGRYWHNRLVQDSSSAPEATLWRYETKVDLKGDPSRALEVAEEFWPAAGDLGRYLLNNGFNFARHAHDSAAMVRWADRNVDARPDLAAFTYESLLSLPAVRAFALARLRATARRLQTRQDSLRPLERTVAEQARRDSAAARGVLVTIGDALIADGQYQAGRDTLELATASGWDPVLFRRVADAELRLGDSTRAIALLARVVIDPATSSSTADSLTRLSRTITSAEGWSRAITNARDVMRNEVLADAVTLPLSRSLRLTTSDGGTRTLTELARGRVSVVVFWSRKCAPSRQQFPQLASLRVPLGSRGIALFPITDEAPSEAVRAYTDSTGAGMTVYHDLHGEATRAFQDFGTPTYFIVDGRGRVRFRYTSLPKLLTQATLLQETENAATTSH